MQTTKCKGDNCLLWFFFTWQFKRKLLLNYVCMYGNFRKNPNKISNNILKQLSTSRKDFIRAFFWLQVTLPSWSWYSKQPKTKRVYQFLWSLFWGTAIQALSEKLPKRHFLTPAWNFNFFWTKCLPLKAKKVPFRNFIHNIS